MIKFSKMHGLGNNFIVIDAINQKINLTTQQIVNLSNVTTGIGFDQCLIIEKSDNADFLYKIFNKDGSEIGQCGNGARCVARFIDYYKLADKKNLILETKTTIITTKLNDDDSVTVNMGIPKFKPAVIPLAITTQKNTYKVKIDEHTYNFHAVNLGNPHAVLIVDNPATIDVPTLGNQLSKHKIFPQQANIGFMQLLTKNSINLRVFERGSGETTACGSGAVAAAAIAMSYYNLDNSITVAMPGGLLTVDWPKSKQEIFLTGPATFVYEGIICNF